MRGRGLVGEQKLAHKREYGVSEIRAGLKCAIWAATHVREEWLTSNQTAIQHTRAV